MQISAPTETIPAAANRPRLPMVGVTQPIGDSNAPSRNVPPNCDDASTMSGVARSERVISIRNANDILPPSAIIAGQLPVRAEHRVASSAPQNPPRIAVQRLQPTRSPSTLPDSAVPKIGDAR